MKLDLLQQTTILLSSDENDSSHEVVLLVNDTIYHKEPSIITTTNTSIAQPNKNQQVSSSLSSAPCHQKKTSSVAAAAAPRSALRKRRSAPRAARNNNGDGVGMVCIREDQNQYYPAAHTRKHRIHSWYTGDEIQTFKSHFRKNVRDLRRLAKANKYAPDLWSNTLLHMYEACCEHRYQAFDDLMNDIDEDDESDIFGDDDSSRSSHSHSDDSSQESEQRQQAQASSPPEDADICTLIELLTNGVMTTTTTVGMEKKGIQLIAMDVARRRHRLMDDVLYWQDATIPDIAGRTIENHNNKNDILHVSDEDLRTHVMAETARKWSRPSRQYAHYVAVLSAKHAEQSER